MSATPTFVKDKTSLVMELEGTSGEYVALTGSHHTIKFFDVTVSPEIESYAQEFASGRHSKGPATMGKRKVTFTAKAALLTSTGTGTPPALGKAWKACGQTLSAPSSTQTYKPDSTKDSGNNVTATIWAVMWSSSSNAAVIVKGKGCMGNCVISMDSLGAPLVATFTFTGALYDIADGTGLALGTVDTGYAPGTVNSTITLGGNPQQVTKFSLDFGNTIALDTNPADATGYAAAYIAQRNPKLMLNTKVRTLSGNDHFDSWSEGTEAAFDLTTAVNNHSRRYQIYAPKAQLVTMPTGSNGDMWTWDQTYELHESSGDDAHSVVMK